jgi:CBS domain-containing protein
MKVSDIMSGRVVTIGQKEPVIAAARLLKRMNLGALPVTDDSGRLRGILTDRDIVLRCVAAGADPKTLEIREIMSRGVVTAAPGADVAEAARLMRGDQVRRLPVVDHGKLVGMVCRCDMEAAAALADISSNLRRAQVPKKSEENSK